MTTSAETWAQYEARLDVGTGGLRLSYPVARGLLPAVGRRDVFFLQSANEVFVGGFGDDAVKLVAIIVDETDILDHDVVNFPALLSLVEFVIDGKLLSLFRQDLAVDFGVLLVLTLTCVNKLFVVKSFDSFDVRPLQQVREGFGEFTLLFRRAPPPVRAEGAFRHFGKVKAR